MTEVEQDFNVTNNLERVEQQDLDGEEGKEEEKELKFDNLTPEELEEVCEVFDIFDKNKDETIEVSAFGTVLRWLGYNPTETELKNW